MKSGEIARSFMGLIFFGEEALKLPDDDHLYVSLHFDDPGVDGNQATAEAYYPGYRRGAVPKGESGWTRKGAKVVNRHQIDFPKPGKGCEGHLSISHIAIGLYAEGEGMIVHTGSLGVWTDAGGYTPLTYNVRKGGALFVPSGCLSVAEW